MLRGCLLLVWFHFFEDESIGFVNTSGKVGGGEGEDKRKVKRSGIARVCSIAGIGQAQYLAQALEGKKPNTIQLVPTHLHQQCSSCLTEDIRTAGKKLLCLQDIGE